MKRLTAAVTLSAFALTAGITMAQVLLPSEVEIVEGREAQDNAAAFIQARYTALDTAARAFVSLAENISVGLQGDPSTYDLGRLVLVDEQQSTQDILTALEAGLDGKKISAEAAAARQQSLRERRREFVATAETAKRFEPGMQAQCGLDFRKLTRYFVGGARSKELIERYGIDQLTQLLSYLEMKLGSAGYSPQWAALAEQNPQQAQADDRFIHTSLNRYYRELALPPPVNAEVRLTLAAVMHQSLVLIPQEKFSAKLECSGLNNYLGNQLLQELAERMEFAMANSDAGNRGTAD